MGLRRHIWLVTMLLGAAAIMPASAAAERPNLVVVMTDDQTVSELADMPHTRRLIGAKGVRFDRSYVSFPVCCPSRATYLTGQYAHNHGVMGLYPPTGGEQDLPKSQWLPHFLPSVSHPTAPPRN